MSIFIHKVNSVCEEQKLVYYCIVFIVVISRTIGRKLMESLEPESRDFGLFILLTDCADIHFLFGITNKPQERCFCLLN
jgi:hypothetical protein